MPKDVKSQKWYMKPIIPGILAAIIFSIIALAMAGYIDLPKLNDDSWEHDYGSGCPTEPNPPCGSLQGSPGEIQSVVAGVYVLNHCECPRGTHPYADVGDTIYCECDE